VLFYTSAYAQAGDMLNPKGKELSLTTDGGESFKIKIQALKPPKNFAYDQGWGWGAEETKPKIIIKHVKAWWGKKEISIPLSAYMDLANPNDASLIKSGSEIHLIIKGGDASTSYKAVLIFERGLIRSRKVQHGEFPDDAWEETKYSFNELDI